VDAPGNHIVKIPVDISGSFVQTGLGETVVSMTGRYEFDVGDGGTLYVLGSNIFDRAVAEQDGDKSAKLNVIVNWFEQVRELAPASR
jgi:hypothetical protein